MASPQTGMAAVTPDMTPAQMREYYLEQTARSLEAWETEHFDIHSHPPFPLERDEALEFTITPEIAKRIGLRAQVEAFAKEAQVSTAGVRENQNVLCPWDHRYRINEYIFAIIAEALSMLAKEVQPERLAQCVKLPPEEAAKRLGPENLAIVEDLFGMKLPAIQDFVCRHPVRIVGSEVRSNSPRFIDLVARIYAANGLYTFLMEDARSQPGRVDDRRPVGLSNQRAESSKTSAIFMWSFLTFVLGLSGGDYFTSSHGAPQKQSDKILGPDGSQYLPPQYMRIVEHMFEILEKCEKKGYTIHLAARHDPHLWRHLSYPKIAKLYASYLRKGPASPAALDRIREATRDGLRLKLDFFGGAGYRTIASIFRELGILDVFEDGFIRGEEDPFFHNIGFRVAPVKGASDAWEVVHDSVDASLVQVVKTAGYETLLKDAPIGQAVFNVDPDVDRFVVGQVLPQDAAGELDRWGISWLPLGTDRIFAVFSPNQFFLMVADNDLEVARADGDWEQYDNFDIHTYVSALAWDEWAERNAIPFIRVPVGFKEIAAVVRDVEKAIRANPGGAIQVKNERGDVLKLGGRPKVHHAGEESGGRIGGPREQIYNVLGEGVIAMREKSSGETCLSAVSLMARLHLESQQSGDPTRRYLHRYLERIFEENNVSNPMEFRGDIVHYNEAIVDPAVLAKAKEQGIGERVAFNAFFHDMAKANAEGRVSLDDVRRLLAEAIPGMAEEWQRLERVDLWSDGIQMWFAPGGKVRDICLRPSGTDAKSKIYFDGTDKAYLRDLFEQHLRGFRPAISALYREKVAAGAAS